MFEEAFKNIEDTLRKDAGVSNKLDYIELTSWILFLKYLSDFDEKDRYDIVLTNPHFAGKKRAEVQKNFPINTLDSTLIIPPLYQPGKV